MDRKRRRSLRPFVDILDDRCLPTVATPLPAGLSPVQVRTAYGINSMQFISQGVHYAADGAGQTIAIVDAYHDPFALNDLQVFDKTFNLPDPPNFTQYNLSGDWNTSDDTAGETTLDIEWAHAMAPGANIVLVETPNFTVDGLLQGIDFARNLPNVSIVSLSYGYPQNEVPNPEQYDHFFTTPAGHQGVTFFVSSGDNGTAPPYGGVEWPASSPNVVAVGGTTLSINSTTGYQGESIWGAADTSSGRDGTGGGYASFVPEPSWQYKIQQTGKRSVPDVAMLADSNTGVAQYFTVPSFGESFWFVDGGTSLSAPLWAGLMAIVNEGRQLQGLRTLDGPTETLPALYSLPSSDFNQIAVNGPGFQRNYAFGPITSPSTVITTGLGSPAGEQLILDLINPPTAPATTAPATTNPVVSTVFGTGFGFVAPTSDTTTTHAGAHKTTKKPATHKAPAKPVHAAPKKPAHVQAAKHAKAAKVAAHAAPAVATPVVTEAQAQLMAAFDAAIPSATN